MTKKVLNNLIKLDMKDVNFTSNFFTNNEKTIQIKTSDDSRELNVDIDITKCYFGGYRYWFLCPGYKKGSKCNRRVRIIYRHNKKWGCRKCMNLTYRSQNLGGVDKLFGVDINLLSIKKYFHGGKPTKKYQRYLNKEQKNTVIKNRIFTAFSKKIKKKMEKLKHY